MAHYPCTLNGNKRVRVTENIRSARAEERRAEENRAEESRGE
jgi:hypothetical protein